MCGGGGRGGGWGEREKHSEELLFDSKLVCIICLLSVKKIPRFSVK